MTAAAVIFPRRPNGVAVGRFEQPGLLDQVHEICGQAQRLFAQGIDAGLGEDAERAEQRRAVEQRGGADLPGACPGRAFPVVRHIELPFLAVPPPAGESGTHPEVLAIDIERPHAARTGIQVLIGTPEREIDLPIVEPMGNGAGGMRAIEPGDDAALAGGEGDALDIEELAGTIEHRGQHCQRHLASHGGDDIRLIDRAAVTRGNADQIARGITALERYLALQGVDIGREIELGGDDLAAGTGRGA